MPSNQKFAVKLALGVVGLLGLAGAGYAQSVSMVKDIETRLTGLAPQNFVQVGGLVYFSAWRVGEGRELWKTDGTVAGTTLIHDIAPGPFESSPYLGLKHRGALYLSAHTEEYGDELWRLVFDECPDDDSKIEPGGCGCNIADVDTDLDGTLDCFDGCMNDPAKMEPGICGCGGTELDLNSNDVIDCLSDADFAKIIADAMFYTKALGRGKRKLATLGLTKKQVKRKVRELAKLIRAYDLDLLSLTTTDKKFNRKRRKASRSMRKAAKRTKARNFKKRKRLALRILRRLQKSLT